MSFTSEQYTFKQCTVNLWNGGTRLLKEGIYPVVVQGTGIVNIDIVKPTVVTAAEFARLQAERFAHKVA